MDAFKGNKDNKMQGLYKQISWLIVQLTYCYTIWMVLVILFDLFQKSELGAKNDNTPVERRKQGFASCVGLKQFL